MQIYNFFDNRKKMTVISKNQGNQVKVTYMEQNDNWVVYEIEIMSD